MKIKALGLLGLWFLSFSPLAENLNEQLERAPYIEKIEMVYNVPYIEVFMTGRVPLDCFNKKQIDISINEHQTIIVPRYIYIAKGDPCVPHSGKIQREKIADLDPSNPASYSTAVLGFQGLHHFHLKGKKP